MSNEKIDTNDTPTLPQIYPPNKKIERKIQGGVVGPGGHQPREVGGRKCGGDPYGGGPKPGPQGGGGGGGGKNAGPKLGYVNGGPCDLTDTCMKSRTLPHYVVFNCNKKNKIQKTEDLGVEDIEVVIGKEEECEVVIRRV